jgi:hypothetical protein
MSDEVQLNEINQRLRESHVLALQGFRFACIKISKLLVEIWLKTGEGREFQKDINEIGIVKALARRGMELPEEWLTATLDENTLSSKIEVLQVGTVEGLKYVWRIPYAAWPQAGVTREELEQWIEICDEWITTQQYENPYAPFPKPISPYVPFGTF